MRGGCLKRNGNVQSAVWLLQVVFLGFLPAVAINEEYARGQLNRLRRGEAPDDQWREPQRVVADQDAIKAPDGCGGFSDLYHFSRLGRCLMGIENWE